MDASATEGPVAERRAAEALASAGNVLDGLDRALLRLEEGSYGRCEVCASEIDDDVLERDPASSCCALHGQPGPK